MPDELCDAQRAAGVTGRGLDPELVERSLPQDATVAHAVEGDTASKAEVVAAGDFLGVGHRLEHDVFGHLLDRRGHVHVLLRERRLGLARLVAEQVVEALRRHPQPGRVVEVAHGRAGSFRRP